MKIILFCRFLHSICFYKENGWRRSNKKNFFAYVNFFKKYLKDFLYIYNVRRVGWIWREKGTKAIANVCISRTVVLIIIAWYIMSWSFITTEHIQHASRSCILFISRVSFYSILTWFYSITRRFFIKSNKTQLCADFL